jgi:hypothetical protein
LNDSDSLMRSLIAASYSEQEAEKFLSYKISHDELETIAGLGHQVLQNIPKKGHACAHMSALWGAFVRDKTNIPVHVVAGNLSINDKKVFFNAGSAASIKAEINQSDLAWDGHVG